MKRRMLTALLLCALCLTLFPAAALADAEPVEAEPAADIAPEEAPAEEPAAPAADGGDFELADADTGEWSVSLYAPAYGESMTLTVSVIGDDDDITLQWYEEVPDADDPNLWHDVPLEGETGYSYTTPPIESHRRYRCIAEDGSGNRGYVWYYIYVDNALEAVGKNSGTNWDEIEVPYGGPVTMEVEVTANDTEGLTYRWYRCEYEEVEDGYLWLHKIPIEGAEGSSYSISSLTQADEYRCDVTDKFGGTADVTFRLRVDNQLKAVDVVSGRNTNDLDVVPGADVTMEVTATAKDLTGVAYQWYIERLEDEDADPIEGATESRYTVRNINAAQTYYCEVTDRFGSSVYVYYRLRIDTGLKAWVAGKGEEENWYSEKYDKGAAPTLAVEAKAADMAKPLSFDWYGATHVDEGSYDYWDRDEEPCAHGESYTVPALTGKAQYVCVVTDAFGNKKEVTFNLSIDNHFEAKPEKQVVTAPYGQDAVLRIIASADEGPITYQWYTNTQNEYGWTQRQDIEGATEATYTVKAETYARYWCDVKDPYGDRYSEFVSVEVENHFTAYAAGTQEDNVRYDVPLGTTKILAVDAHADSGELTYQWYHAEPTPGGWKEFKPMEGGTGASVTTDAINEMESYYCEVKDQYGAEREVYLQVYVEDDFTLEPVGTYVKTEEPHAPGVWTEFAVDVYYIYAKPGENVTLQGRAAGTGVTLQWSCMTDPWWGDLEGETKDTLVRAVDQDMYYGLSAKNAYGEQKWLYFKIVVSGDAPEPQYDPLDVNHDTKVDPVDAALFLKASDADSAGKVLRRFLDLG